MLKFLLKIIIFKLLIFLPTYSFAENQSFDLWLKDFKLRAVKYGVSNEVVEDVMSNAKFLPKVIEYDRYQPEFYEDTFTYIRKRSSKKIKEGIRLYKKEKNHRSS